MIILTDAEDEAIHRAQTRDDVLHLIVDGEKMFFDETDPANEWAAKLVPRVRIRQGELF